MWPLLVDITKEESIQNLRCLELEAYASIVTALRAQGPLSPEKLTILKEIGSILNISQERHKAEIRRVVNDEKLSTIASHVSGQNGFFEDWAQEGRRLVPLLPRVPPQTAYTAIADDVADVATSNNKLLPLPSHTERKRTQQAQPTQHNVPDTKNIQPRISDVPKAEDSKKRKLSYPQESCSMMQHLMGPPKLGKIQQIYRQRTKARAKEHQMHLKIKQEQDQTQPRPFQQSSVQASSKLPLSPQPNIVGNPKINILQNMSMQSTEESTPDHTQDNIDSEIKQESNQLQVTCTNENHAPKSKYVVTTSSKVVPSIPLKAITSPGSSTDMQKPLKICPRRTITKTMPSGQKLIVVSSAQTTPTNSILQRTLTIPFVKNLAVKNFDKFKIVTTTTVSNNTSIVSPTAVSNLNSSKHKVVTVRTNSSMKKVSLSHLQVLNAKGNIKVLPFGGKILAKSCAGTSPNLYVMNSTDSLQAVTKSTTSTPVVMTSKMQGPSELNDNSNGAKDDISVEHFKPAEEVNTDDSKSTGKSSVLADILKASGVTPSDAEACSDDIETHISQLTAIPQNSTAIQDVQKDSLTKSCAVQTTLEGIDPIENSCSLDEVNMDNGVTKSNSVDGEPGVEGGESATTMEIVDEIVNISFPECLVGETVVLPGDDAVCVEIVNSDVPVVCSTN